jgi:hypothetical protein
LYFVFEVESHYLLPGLSLNLESSCLHLQHSSNYRCVLPCHAQLSFLFSVRWWFPGFVYLLKSRSFMS